jgi:hypothetical protein
MNERIRQLAKEAGFEIDNGPILPGLTTITMKVGGLYVGVPVEKFAELIVGECADVACKHMELNEGVDYNVGEKIKQHFGVEE